MKIVQFFSGWTFNRWFQFGLATFAGIYAIVNKEYSLFVVTAWLGILAVFNISCCGSSGCSTNHSVEKESKNEDITVTYKEIK